MKGSRPGAISLVLRLAPAVLALCAPTMARALDGGLDLVSPETLQAYADVRAVAVDGERSWSQGGFGKLRYGADARGLKFSPRIGEAGLVWRPKFGWSLSGTVVVLAQDVGDPDASAEAGLSEAFLTYRPLGGGPVRVTARAGLMWPPVSLEHSGARWEVADAITPSAIGSWLGEEVKVVGLEVTAKTRLGSHDLAATIGGFGGNDTAGALLTFRGWALHDGKALAFQSQPLPPLSRFMRRVQPQYTHPLMSFGSTAIDHPGHYEKLTWSPPAPVRVEATHYDNNGDPRAVNADLEWGWLTRFDTLGLVAGLGEGLELKAQAMAGQTIMGVPRNGRYWINMRYQAAYAQLTRRWANSALSGRLDVFSTRNGGRIVTCVDDEDGWAATVAARRDFGPHYTALVEYLHVRSERDARQRAMSAPDQTQNQLQLVLRVRY